MRNKRLKNTKSQEFSSKMEISRPQAFSSKISKNREINNNKFDLKPVSKPIKVKTIEKETVTKKMIKSPTNVENMANYHQSPYLKQKFINDACENKSLKKNYSEFGAIGNDFRKINYIYSKNENCEIEIKNKNCNYKEDYNQIQIDENVLTLSNQGKININSKSQDLVFIRNKYKNIIEKFC